MEGKRASAAPGLAWVTVDLGAVAANFDRVRSRAGVDVYAVVKADAYGHGAVEVARTLSGRRGLRGLVVARTQEGEELRRAGIEDEILLLSPGLAAAGAANDSLDRLRASRLSPYLASLADVDMAVEAAGSWTASDRIDVHLEVDTGMARAGLPPEQVPQALDALSRAPALRLRGLATHLAESEVAGSTFTAAQLDLFRDVVGDGAPEQQPLVVHAANSAAALDHPEARFDAVRVGGALYGLDLARVGSDRLRPAMRVVARVLQVRAIAAGTPVGYGRRWRAPTDTRVALLPVGYADGYPSNVGERGRVLLGGRRHRIVGAVSMDLITVDLGETECSPGDEAVLLGDQGDEGILAEELAQIGSEVLYEVTCRFSRRLPRLHRGSAETVERRDAGAGDSSAGVKAPGRIR